MQKNDITFASNGIMYVAPTGVRILSRCIASSEYSCTFRYFATLDIDTESLKQVIANMTESETEYIGSDKSIVMQTRTERDAFDGLVYPTNITSIGEIDMTNHVITSKADFTEVYIHLPNRFGNPQACTPPKPFIMNGYNEIDLDITHYSGLPQSFKEYCYDGRDFQFNAIAIYVNITDGKNSYNSLYGIYVPSKDAEPIQKYSYSEDSSIVHSGNSFGFRINLRLVEDADNNGAASAIQTVVDEKTNSFALHMFTDALARMQMVMSQNKDLSESFSTMHDDIENLKALCDTGTTIAELSSKLAKLSEYVDNYMLAIEDKDSLLNMIANLNKQLQSIINGEAGPSLQVKIPVQAGQGIYINTSGDAYVINNANQRYHITDGSSFTKKESVTRFTPTTYSNIFPVYSKSSSPLSNDVILVIDLSNIRDYRFHQGQSFQFPVISDINWNGKGCILKVGDRVVGTFTKDDIQCSRPIFEIICTSSNNGSDEGGDLSQSEFWSRCINPKYEGTFGEDSIVPVTYDEAIDLRDKGALSLNKVYYLTDYAFVPEEDSDFTSINNDILISIFMKPSDQTHFDRRVYMSFNTPDNGRVSTWGEYYLTRDGNEVEGGSRLKKGYITLLEYKSISADFDFIHCAVKKSATPTDFDKTTGVFAQSLKGGDYDDWITSDTITGSRCSINNVSAINPTYLTSDEYAAIDIDDNDNISVSSHNNALFRLPIIHISSCSNVCTHDCDKMLLYGVSDAVIRNTTDIMAKSCTRIDVSSCDNIRLWKAYHSTTIHAFNSWVYNSENVSLRNVTAVLLDSHIGSSINEITGCALVVLNYYTGDGTRKGKAIIDSVSDGCVITDSTSKAVALSPSVDSWRIICNKYNALAVQRSSGSTRHDYYIVKDIVYLDDNEEISSEIKKIVVNSDNIDSLI